MQRLRTDPTTPTTQRCTSVTCDGFGLLPVRSPLLGESRLISSPPGTEMVQFPGCAFRTLWIQIRMTDIQPVGLPHSAIRGSRDVCSSPRLIAAYHGLHRTAAPRHSPWTLSRLTILSFALQPRFRAANQRFTPRDSPQRLVPQAPQRPPEAPFPLRESTRSSQRFRTRPPRILSSLARHLPLGQQLLSALLFTLPLRCQRSRTLEVWGLEPQTYGLQSHRSSH